MNRFKTVHKGRTHFLIGFVEMANLIIPDFKALAHTMTHDLSIRPIKSRSPGKTPAI